MLVAIAMVDGLLKRTYVSVPCCRTKVDGIAIKTYHACSQLIPWW